MSDNVKVDSSGLGLGSILTIIFVLAKLFHLVTWSWWVVFLPFLVSLFVTLSILALVLIAVGVAAYVAGK